MTMNRTRAILNRIEPIYKILSEIRIYSPRRPHYLQTHRLSCLACGRIQVELPRRLTTYQRIQHFRKGPVNTKNDAAKKPKETSQNKSTTSGAEKSVFQRFKETYKKHGKILVGVHLVTSAVWFGSFYFTVVSGVDVVGILEKLGASETILKPFRSSSLGSIAVAYLMYKIATPARYTVTLAGTNFVIRYLRKTGKMSAVQQQNKLRSLVAEGTSKGKKRLHTKRRSIQEKVKANMKMARVRTGKMTNWVKNKQKLKSNQAKLKAAVRRRIQKLKRLRNKKL